jgi:D-glycero-D-manno-heptose 1,7-bisphosphate phosphatase
MKSVHIPQNQSVIIWPYRVMIMNQVYIQKFAPVKCERIVIVDRDGTLNLDKGYEHEKENLSIIPEAISFLTKAAYLGFGMVIATNQGGAALGKFSIDQSLEFNAELAATFSRLDIVLSSAYICFHHPLSSDEDKRNCSCRKPKPGMLTQVLLDYGLGNENALVVGDQDTDAQAAARAGIQFRKIGNRNLWDLATNYLEEF